MRARPSAVSAECVSSGEASRLADHQQSDADREREPRAPAPRAARRVRIAGAARPGDDRRRAVGQEVEDRERPGRTVPRARARRSGAGRGGRRSRCRRGCREARRPARRAREARAGGSRGRSPWAMMARWTRSSSLLAAPSRSRAVRALPSRRGAFVIAADSGADHALALGVPIDLAVGDFDSISAAGLATLERHGVRLERHPVDKEATDLELALDAAVAAHPRRVVVVGGTGGRLDHVLGELSLFAAGAYRGARARRAARPSDGARRVAASAASTDGSARSSPCSRCTGRRRGSSPTGWSIRCAVRRSCPARRAACRTCSPRHRRNDRARKRGAARGSARLAAPRQEPGRHHARSRHRLLQQPARVHPRPEPLPLGRAHAADAVPAGEQRERGRRRACEERRIAARHLAQDRERRAGGGLRAPAVPTTEGACTNRRTVVGVIRVGAKAGRARDQDELVVERARRRGRAG